MTPSSSDPTVQQLFDLSGQTALVTGGGGHLGTAICSALAEAGASVIVTSRDARKAEALAQELPAASGARHFGILLNQLQTDSLESCFERACALTGNISILVNNAHEGVAADWNSITPEQFNRQLQNATAYFSLAKQFRDQVVQRQTDQHDSENYRSAGSIIMLGSMYGVVGSYPDAYTDISIASPVAYHALKGGVVHMTRHLAVYWARDRVRVNCLSPGPFPAPGVSSELVNRLSAKSPMGRMGSPSELKGAVLFLASGASSYVTGQNLIVDGGWTAW